MFLIEYATTQNTEIAVLIMYVQWGGTCSTVNDETEQLDSLQKWLTDRSELDPGSL